ncbi:MAG: hypothetical protein MJ175_04260, partial [Clostridia bacterium]|nr:hypothetical protein [Clostridia bacterium]
MILENEQDLIVLENDYIRREITFRFGKPIHSVIVRKESGYRWESPKDEAVLTLPGFDWANCETTYEDNMVLFESNYTVRWVFEVPETVPCIRSRIFARGCTADETEDEEIDGLRMIGEINSAAKPKESEVCERVSHTGRHLKVRAVTFRDRTDLNDSLVSEEERSLYGHPVTLDGSLFFVSDPTADEVCMIAKDAPVGIAHLNRTAPDFTATYGSLAVSGTGIDYSALSKDHFTAGYPVTIAVCRTGMEAEISRACYAESCGELSPFIMSNTWGDRSQDKAVCEEFIKAEILRAEQIGVDIVQIDDGWQTGRSVNSAVAQSNVWNGGFYENNPDFWVPDETKFPSGFGALCDFAYSHGVALGLWFSPDASLDYANWKKDAEVLSGFYRTYGIRHFKMDGIDIVSKEGERNLLRLCYKVMMESEGRASFQMDLTAERRLGYFYEKGLGSLFVENRYTDWGNYYPHNTLRNLWQLSHYIPAQRLQFEVLNLHRNEQNYKDDVLAPSGYPIDYVFASVMAANPLIWMEMQHLPEEDVRLLKGLVEVYRQHRDDFVEVMPMGECPSGFSLTGFYIRGR